MVHEYQNPRDHRTTSRHTHPDKVLQKPSPAQLISVSMYSSEAGCITAGALMGIDGSETRLRAGSVHYR